MLSRGKAMVKWSITPPLLRGAHPGTAALTGFRCRPLPEGEGVRGPPDRAASVDGPPGRRGWRTVCPGRPSTPRAERTIACGLAGYCATPATGRSHTAPAHARLIRCDLPAAAHAALLQEHRRCVFRRAHRPSSTSPSGERLLLHKICTMILCNDSQPNTLRWARPRSAGGRGSSAPPRVNGKEFAHRSPAAVVRQPLVPGDGARHPWGSPVPGVRGGTGGPRAIAEGLHDLHGADPGPARTCHGTLVPGPRQAPGPRSARARPALATRSRR